MCRSDLIQYYITFIIKYWIKDTQKGCSIKKCVLKNFAKFTAKHLHLSLFLINLQGSWTVTLLKKGSIRGTFLWILWNLNTLLTEHLGAATSGCSIIGVFIQSYTRSIFNAQLLSTIVFKALHFTCSYLISKSKKNKFVCRKMSFGNFKTSLFVDFVSALSSKHSAKCKSPSDKICGKE